jgi:hypothetical protein
MLEHLFSLHDESTSLNIEIFGHFEDYWPSIHQVLFSKAMDVDTTAALVAPWIDTVITFASTQLGDFQPGDDYQ